MVQYTLAQSPEVHITVPGKDSGKARERAMDQLMTMLDAGELPTALADGFSPSQLVEVREQPPSNRLQQQEAEVVQAIQVLNHLSTLKVKLQASRADALAARTLVDSLFSADPLDDDQLAQLKEGFKVLKSFAHSNLRFRDAKAEAEQARRVLDEALAGGLG